MQQQRRKEFIVQHKAVTEKESQCSTRVVKNYRFNIVLDGTRFKLNIITGKNSRFDLTLSWGTTEAVTSLWRKIQAGKLLWRSIQERLFYY